MYVRVEVVVVSILRTIGFKQNRFVQSTFFVYYGIILVEGKSVNVTLDVVAHPYDAAAAAVKEQKKKKTRNYPRIIMKTTTMQTK